MTSSTPERAPIGYYASVDVLPLELSQAVYAALNNVSRKITFGAGASALTKTECMLPESLVWQCRGHLDQLALTKRTVLIAKYRPREVPRHLAYALARFAVQAGSTIAAAADALDYHTNSLVLWGIRRGTTAPSAPPTDDAAELALYMEAGKAYCESIKAKGHKNAMHYAWVGWFRAIIESVCTTAKQQVEQLAKAGGPASAAAAVYQMPTSSIAQLGHWIPTQSVQPPTGTDDERKRWHAAGRAYCLQYGKPVPVRHQVWVGWFLELLAKEPSVAQGHVIEFQLAPPAKEADE